MEVAHARSTDVTDTTSTIQLLGVRITLEHGALFKTPGNGSGSWPALKQWLSEEERKHEGKGSRLVPWLRSGVVFFLSAAFMVAAYFATSSIHIPDNIDIETFTIVATYKAPRCSHVTMDSVAKPSGSDAFLHLSSLEPGRAWREILAAAPKSDLMHFTIGRNATQIGLVDSAHTFAKPVYMIIPFWAVRALTFNLLRPRSVTVNLELGADERDGLPPLNSCLSDLSSNVVAAVSYAATAFTGKAATVALAQDSLPPDSGRWRPSLETAMRNGYLPFDCETTLHTRDEPPTPWSYERQALRLSRMALLSCEAGLDSSSQVDAFLAFIALSATLTFAISLVVMSSLRTIAARKLSEALLAIGAGPFLIRQNAHAVARERLEQNLLEAFAPLFLMDYLVSNPISCNQKCGDATLSACIHWLFLTIPTALLAFGSVIAGCGPSQAAFGPKKFDALCSMQIFALGFICWVQIFGSLYFTSWYLDLSWTTQKLLRLLWWPSWVLSVALSLAYIAQCLLALCLALLLRPEQIGPAILTLLIPVVYCYCKVAHELSACPCVDHTPHVCVRIICCYIPCVALRVLRQYRHTAIVAACAP